MSKAVRPWDRVTWPACPPTYVNPDRHLLAHFNLPRVEGGPLEISQTVKLIVKHITNSDPEDNRSWGREALRTPRSVGDLWDSLCIHSENPSGS